MLSKYKGEKKASFFKSLGFAINGIKLALEERHVRVHIVVALLVVAAGFFFKISQTEWLVCLLLFALIISLEIINTAIEQLVNLVNPQWHPLAGKVKDLSAGAILVASLIAIVCAVLIFGKYILALLQTL